MGMFPLLPENRNALAGTVSGRQQRIARALIQRPEMPLLDEPILEACTDHCSLHFSKIHELNVQLKITQMIAEQKNAKSALAISHKA